MGLQLVSQCPIIRMDCIDSDVSYWLSIGFFLTGYVLAKLIPIIAAKVKYGFKAADE